MLPGPTQLRRRFLCAVTCTFLCIFGFIRHLQPTPLFFESHAFFTYDLSKEEPLVADQKCQIPKVHPFDPSILCYLRPPKPIYCKQRTADLTQVDRESGVLRFNWTALKLGGYSAGDLKCDYREVIRRNDFEVDYGEARRLPVNGTKIESDFVYVSCYNFVGIAFYSNIHCRILPKKKFVSSIDISLKNESTYNVLIFGIDSMSRLSFIRHLPKTYEYLTNTLNGFVFRGMTKVGDNTYPNLAAVLTGRSVLGSELPPIQKDLLETYDEWPCLWKHFSNAGYATLFAEDRPDIGLFNYYRGGFRIPPTDHYMRPFWLAVESSKLHRVSSNLCFGNTPKHLLQLQYTGDFVKKYSELGRPFFAFSFLVELSHDYVGQVSSADDDLTAWLSDLADSGYLERTFLLFLSDHGHRFDPMRATLVGRIEERMPFLAVVVPQPLLSSNRDIANNLKINRGRLTTPYDIYFTALDVLGMSVNNSKIGSATSSRGTSLFGQISTNRSCPDAGIPDHYCICEVEEELRTSDPRSQKAGNVLTAAINELLVHHGNFCSVLMLQKVVRADIIVPRREVLFNSRVYFGKLIEDGVPKQMINKIRVIARTVPGQAMFEGTLLFRDGAEDDISVLGDISRINRYGNQSSCIQDPILRKYCYCSDLLR